MKSLSYAPKPPQDRKWIINSPYNQIIFEDSQIELKSKIKIQNGKIKRIKFHLINLKNTNPNLYEICSITRHVNMYIQFPDYILIHAMKSGSNIEQKYNVDGNQLNHPEFDIGKKLVFLFKIYEDDCPETPSYELQDGTPDSKEGSIIIGI